MKKQCLLVFCLLPLLLGAQKIRVNEMDRFIKQKRIETFPLPILSAAKNKMSVTLSAVGTALYLQLSGSGIGANRIDENDRVIFLFENDSTVTIHSKGYQNFEIGISVNSYVHSYRLTHADLVKLSKHQLQALRKYHADQFDDVFISKEAGEQFRKLMLVFMNELAKEKLIPRARAIAASDVVKYIGDSVTFVSRIAGSRYLFEAQDATTLLDVGSASPNQLLTAVISDEDQSNFSAPVQSFFNGKQVRISGRVTSVNGRPQMRIRHPDQLEVLEDTAAVAAAGNAAPSKPSGTTKTAPVATPSSAPGFPGGYEVWMAFLNRNLKPPTELAAGEKKTVVVQFKVSVDGTVSDIQVVQSAGAAFDKEVLRVLARMPKWKAAIENGKPAHAIVTQPVTFHGVQKQQAVKAF